jgi:hypothetical protein
MTLPAFQPDRFPVYADTVYPAFMDEISIPLPDWEAEHTFACKNPAQLQILLSDEMRLLECVLRESLLQQDDALHRSLLQALQLRQTGSVQRIRGKRNITGRQNEQDRQEMQMKNFRMLVPLQAAALRVLTARRICCLIWNQCFLKNGSSENFCKTIFLHRCRIYCPGNPGYGRCSVRVCKVIC